MYLSGILGFTNHCYQQSSPFLDLCTSAVVVIIFGSNPPLVPVRHTFHYGGSTVGFLFRGSVGVFSL